MSELDAPIGPGRLVLVVGPSGAGKDTLLNLAHQAYAGDGDTIFAQRVVTRESSCFEKNTSATEAQFDAALACGDFALHWQAHGLRYGIARAMESELQAGRTVVVNVSRTVVARARATYACVVVVEVSAPLPVLVARLTARGRVSDGPAENRLRRPVPDVVPDVIITNVGDPSLHAASLIRAIRAGGAIP